MVLFLLKPIIFAWAGLRVLDDLASVMKITRLVGSSLLSPLRRDESKDSMCDLCDDIVAGLMAGTEGVQAVPCSWLCLRVPKCMRMCETIKDVTSSSTKFPCVSAGYCTEDEADEDDVYGLALTQMECAKGPLFSCEPKRYCRRQRKRWKWTCNPKPGIGRWVGMQRAASTHTAALAAGILSQKRCGEPDAGPFCVVAPSGIGKFAEIVGVLLSLVYGGYHSIVAIETPGGDDDQQWLTFWIILVETMVLEQVFMRVLLSKFPFYYETKLLLLIWLMFFGGATYFYRRLRRTLAQCSPYLANMMNHRSNESAQRQLDSLIDIGGEFIVDQLAVLERNVERNPARRSSALALRQALDDNGEGDSFAWEYDYTDALRNSFGTKLDAAEKLFLVVNWLMGGDTILQMEKCNMSKETIAMLLERAAALVSFHPRFLNIHLIGTKSSLDGHLPPMGRNGKVDSYVRFRVRSNDTPGRSGHTEQAFFKEEVSSRIVCKNVAPRWNEKLELRLKGGKIDLDGNFRNSETRKNVLVVEAWDADIGFWGVGLDIFQVSFFILISGLFAGHVTGVLDSFFSERTTQNRASLELAIVSLVFLNFVGLAVCYLMANVFRADDELIGSCEVPLGILLDQREHALCLHLQKPSSSERKGILRVKLYLSE